MAWAQSACTALWGINLNNQLTYLNKSTGQFTTATAALAVCTGGGGCNALTGSNINGLLYFVVRNTGELYTYNPSTATGPTLVGTIPAPTAPATRANTLGAAMTAAGNLYVFATSGSTPPTPSFVALAQINTASAATVTSWTQVRTTANATPTISGSGDISVDNSGVAYIISNTTPSPTYHIIDLTAGANFGRTTTPPTSITGAQTAVAGVAVDPVTGNTYFSVTGPTSSATYVLNRTSGTTTLAGTNSPNGLTDLGNCPVPPAPPTVSKAFSPSGYSPVTTQTLIVTIGNPNTAAIWVMSAFQDALPAGMVVGPTPAASGSCYTGAIGTGTFTAGATTPTLLAANSKIPAGGCTIGFTVSATASLTAYTNTIPAGSLSTTAGTNTLAATSTLKVGTDFTVLKQSRAGTSGPFLNTTTVGVGRTVDYVLTFTNSVAGGTGTMTYTDTLRVGFTPVYTLTFNLAGGATTCNGATSTAAVSQPRVTGTFAGPPGSSCSVTVRVRGSTTAAVNVVNTVTLAGLSTGDTVATNNRGTSTVTVSALTTLTVVKNVTPSGTVAPNTSLLYTVTVANLGPVAAPGTRLTDPAVSGLTCSTVTCTGVTNVAACPLAASTTVAYLQGTGIAIPTLNATSSATFRIGCTAN